VADNSDKSDEPDKSKKSDKYEEAKKAIIFGTGYKKPPEHTRFQKGKSGNPKGRPRKKSASSDRTLAEQPTLAAAHRAADKTISVREGDEIRDVSAREAVIQAMTVAALKGNSRAGALVIGQFREADRAHAMAIEISNNFWSTYKAEKSAELAKAKEEGKPAPSILPHPDDIVIDRLTGPKFFGPFDEEGQRKIDHTIACREVLIMQHVLDERSSKRLDGGPLTEPGAAMLLAIALDHTLPPRLRFSDGDFIREQYQYGRLSKRDLLKLLFKKWQGVGYPRPRGYVSPNRGEIVSHLKLACALCNGVLSGNIDPDTQSKTEIEAEIIDLMEECGIVPTGIEPPESQSAAGRS